MKEFSFLNELLTYCMLGDMTIQSLEQMLKMCISMLVRSTAAWHHYQSDRDGERMERPLAGLLLKAWESLSLSLSLLSCLCLCLCLCLCFFFFFLCSWWWWWWWWWSPCLEDVLSLLNVGMGVPGIDKMACSTEDGSFPME